MSEPRSGADASGTHTRVDVGVTLGAHRLTSPLMAASGCAGFGHELVRWGGLSGFGALVTPTLTSEARESSEPRVIVEAASGIVYPHDIANVGANALTATRLPWEVCGETPVVASIAGGTSGEFADAAAAVRRRTAARGLLGVEMNLSVPNEANSGRPFSRDEYAVTKTVARVREHLPRNLVLFAKLTLGGDVVDLARAALKSGADAIVLGHPPAALSIDPHTLTARTRGAATMAGPALLPMTLAAVHELKAAMIAGRLPTAPIVAGGGVAGARDVVAALAAGATLVQMGSALIRDPRAATTTLEQLRRHFGRLSTSASDMIAAAHR